MTDEQWRARHRLFHYTKSVAAVSSILEHGFLLVPNRRQLIEHLLPNDDFATREPQQFGMVSFTELPVDRARSHREEFGGFGICVSWDWAVRNDAQRVIYLDEEGIVFDRFKWLFELGRQELGPAPTGGMAIINKAIASTYGAQLYHTALTLYEYMETSRNSSQVEWRIVNKLPIHYDLSDRAKLIAKMIEMSHNSPMGTLPVRPDDVEMLVCPRGHTTALRSALPSAYDAVPIFAFTPAASLASLAGAAFQWLAELRRKRDRVIRIPYEPPAGSILLPMTDAQTNLLPPVNKSQGLVLYPDAVRNRVFIAWQYEGDASRWYELRMSTDNAAHLLNLLRDMEHGAGSPRRRGE